MSGERDPERAIRDFEARLQASAFGPATKASYRIESDEEDAHVAAATNLLGKALLRLARGEDEAAAGLARRAVAIEPTRPGELLPAGTALDTLLYAELVDRRDRARDAGWLDPVLALVARATDPGRAELAGMLDALAEGELSGAERGRIRALVPDGARRAEPLAGITGADARLEAVLATLRLLAELTVA